MFPSFHMPALAKQSLLKSRESDNNLLHSNLFFFDLVSNFTIINYCSTTDNKHAPNSKNLCNNNYTFYSTFILLYFI